MEEEQISDADTLNMQEEHAFVTMTIAKQVILIGDFDFASDFAKKPVQTCQTAFHSSSSCTLL